jgi:FtsP/CotA-like multicopper oxidase with cupredoxin domain
MLESDLDPVIHDGKAMVPADAVAKAFQVSVKRNADMNKVQIVTPDALKQFDQEESAVRDVLNGTGLTPHIAADGAKEFTLTAELHPWSPLKGVLTNAWTFNGQAPAPVIRVTEGDHVRLTLVNKLPEATAIHWHGLHLPNTMDGVPGVTQKVVSPGQTFTYDFVASHPGTFMYHSHYDDMKQIGNGMYGAFIIDPKDPSIETKYDHDYTMLLSGFAINGTEDEKDYFTINGRSYPDTTPINVKKGETVRLRLINIDVMEMHTMHLHGIDFQVIAKDGHPAANPQTMNTVLIGPGETYDIAFTADAPGTWMFHCHILDHTMNGGEMPQGEMGGLITLITVTE